MSISLWIIAIGIVSTFMSGLVSLVVILYRRPARASRISSPHGWGLRRFAELCFSKKTFTQVLEPALSDMQKEHFEALRAGRPWQARMAIVRGYWSFWSAVVAQLPIPFARLVFKIWKATNTGS
ncbi:MAG TPA: hypothetical protein VN493_08595 [Thermoanaerobaculia bacterium]|nr:hypothetical protein [Thermoanaerobaculia bacterium]